MRLIVDGVEIPCLNDVKVVYDGDDMEECCGSDFKDTGIHITLTGQGIVKDWVMYEEGPKEVDPCVIDTIQNDLESIGECFNIH